MPGLSFSNLGFGHTSLKADEETLRVVGARPTTSSIHSPQHTDQITVRTYSRIQHLSKEAT